ncbi:MAG: bifunctional 3-deoxy-7-phosphoheptulonate synthase/chorismate mutase type II [Alloprevotella sp.]|nr:bifunctional 3-deoxy-7-phosphoheptulonate synthase/chorismate mutase type II [Alloprevotella sp.]
MPTKSSNIQLETSPLIIAGPCAAESEQQLLETAGFLAQTSVKIFRAGIWKPRTNPNTFEGVGEIGLKWLNRVRREYGLKVATEVATPKHVELAQKYDIDVFWIGARTASDPFAVQALADALKGESRPVWLKNPISPEIDLWCGSVERMLRADLSHLGLIHRGFSTYRNEVYRNSPFWQIPLEMRRRYPSLPLLCDPSHMGGNKNLIGELSQQALNLGYDGLMIEAHIHPDQALSDSSQQLRPQQLAKILSKLVVRQSQIQPNELEVLRHKIDELDETLLSMLAERMQLSRQIGQYKKTENITVFQNDRYGDVLQHYTLWAERCGLSKEFAKQLFENIHAESVRQQIEILKEGH